MLLLAFLRILLDHLLAKLAWSALFHRSGWSNSALSQENTSLQKMLLLCGYPYVGTCVVNVFTFLLLFFARQLKL